MTRVVGLVGRLPTIFRTLRRLRPEQARAQIHHLLFGLAAPTQIANRGASVQLAIDAPATDFLPAPAHVKASSTLEIELLATHFELGESPEWTTSAHGPLFAYHLHQHEYLRSAELTSEQRLLCLTDWIDRNQGGVGWDPHPISLRLLCWGKMLLGKGLLGNVGEQVPVREKLLRSMADQAATLDAGLEVRLQANHLLSNLISVVWVGILLDAEPGGEGRSDGIAHAAASWRGRADDLIVEIDSQIHADGGHEERSPMYHGLILENLLDLLNLCRASRAGRIPEGLIASLENATARMLSALSALTHPDGRISLFADSCFDVCAEPKALRDYASRLGIPVPEESAGASSVILSQTGYARLVVDQTVAIVSTAGPAPAHQPGHAHCDALSIELSVAGRRVITDTGLFEYRPGPRRDRARATASHATLQVDGEEQAEIWSAHRVGGRPTVEVTGWDGEAALEATCRGWSRPKTLHRRAIQVEAGSATIRDQIEGPAASVRLVWPFDSAWRIELVAGEARARACFAGEGEGAVADLLIELSEDLDWRIERGAAFPRFGVEIERDLLVGESTLTDHSGRTFTTCIRQAAEVPAR